MANIRLNAGASVTLDGTEEIPLVKGGVDGKTTAQAIANLAAGGYAATTAVSTAAHSLVAANAGQYLRFTFSGAKTLTVQDDATEAMAADAEIEGRNAASSGDLTLVEDTAVTINPPAGGTLVIPIGGTFALKRGPTDEWDLIGVTVAA